MLDEYDPNMLDDRDQAPLDYAAREKAEERMRQRDAREGRGLLGNRALGAAFAQDSGGEQQGRKGRSALPPRRRPPRDGAAQRGRATPSMLARARALPPPFRPS